jgi:hypothetical protein
VIAGLMGFKIPLVNLERKTSAMLLFNVSDAVCKSVSVVSSQLQIKHSWDRLRKKILKCLL